jgi:5-methyltetrahydropteroyltriglutamate--homocysteine methyltransferase
VYEQERVGLDLVTDGEAQRQAYDRDFLRGLAGIDFGDLERVDFVSEVRGTTRRGEGLAEFHAINRLNPRVVGEISWNGPRALDALQFAKQVARRPLKTNVVGPISLFVRVADHYYHDERALILALADTLNRELLALADGGADVLQIDEPMFHIRLSVARKYGKEAIARTVRGVRVPILLHACYGYALAASDKAASPTYAETIELMAACDVDGISIEYEQPGHEPELLRHCGNKHVALGLLDLGKREAETADHVAARLRAALAVIPPERLHPTSDCGMWFVPRRLAQAKISALVRGTELVRADR